MLTLVEQPPENVALNRERLGEYAFDLLERVCRLFNMSGPMPEGCEPYAERELEFQGNKLRLSLMVLAKDEEE